MPRTREQRIIDEARQSFDAVLHTPEFHDVHEDDAELNLLIDYLAVAPGGHYLDLGTGNGYVALAIAARYRDCRVTGIDIAGKAIERNAELARARGLANVDFAATDGITLDVAAEAFDGVVCRYVLHHLPDLRATLRDVGRALKRSGRFVIADAVMAESDDRDFINRFQSLQPDGHVRIHRSAELLDILAECGFRPLQRAMTSIAYAQPYGDGYRALLAATPARILDAYGIKVCGDEVAARLDILNAALVKE